MAMEIAVRVEGRPPKKDGANSMWTKDSEARKVRALREAVAAKLGGVLPFGEDVEIELVAHIGPDNHAGVGDLDNYVTGILDALQRAPDRTPVDDCPVWQGAVAPIEPRAVLLLMNDLHVVGISARKVRSADQPHYTLRVRHSAPLGAS